MGESEKQYKWRSTLNKVFVGSLTLVLITETILDHVFGLNDLLNTYLFTWLNILSLAIFFVSGVAILFLRRRETQEQLSNIFEKSDQILGLKLKTKVKWFIFFAILVLGLVVRSLGIGSFDFYSDEFQVVSSAKSYAEIGQFYRWDWFEDISTYEQNCAPSDYCDYERAWPHTWMVATSFKIFGMSEFSARIPSLVFGLLLLPLLFYIARFFLKNESLSLLVMFFAAINPHYIHLSRYTRMYAVLIPVILVLVYFLYRALTEKLDLKGKEAKVVEYIDKYLNFQFTWLLVSIPLFVLAVLIHLNSLILLPVFLFFTIYLAVTTKDKRYYSLLTIAGVVFSLLVMLYAFSAQVREIMWFIETFFGASLSGIWRYVNHLTDFPLIGTGGLILTVLSLSLWWFVKEKELKQRLVFLTLLISTTAGFFIFFTDWHDSYVYVSHVTPFVLMLVSLLMLLIVSGIKNIWLKFLIILLFIGSAVGNFVGDFSQIFIDRAKHSEAYQEILLEYTPDQVVVGRYVRNYYLRDLGADINRVHIGNSQDFSYQSFRKFLRQNPQGWLITETSKLGSLHPGIVAHAELHFSKLHGKGVDDTGVEVYRFGSK